MTSRDAETVPVEPLGGADAAPRRSRRGGRVVGVVLVLLAVIAALLVLVETVGRGIAERNVADSIERSLPAGVDGEVDVEIRGFSALWQAMTGSMDEMVATAPDLVVNGIPVDVTVTAYGVPLAEGGTLERGEVEASIDGDAVDEIAASQGITGGLTLGEGTVAYGDEVAFLGIPIGFSITAEPEAAGDRVLLRPVAAEIDAVGGSFDASGLVDRILGGDPFPICVADRLPEGVEVAGIDVEPDLVTVRLEASGLPLAEETLATTGACG
ncbi:LmeA family phospholipid-binding protein [Agromyces sp. SYSU T00266]|uniref:LmeA family phospholipid-binding protein n=1 Tax=Agromyces zhanjiangensis TaxID=3158562 RepID=UPI00339816E1